MNEVGLLEVLGSSPALLLGFQDSESLLEMLHHTVFPNYRVRSWSSLLVFFRVLFFLLDKLFINTFLTDVMLYPYLVSTRGQYYRLLTGYLRCEDGVVLLLHFCIYMQLSSYYQSLIGPKFALLWLGTVLGSGAFVCLVNVVGDPSLAELGLIVGVFSGSSLIKWQSEPGEEGLRKLNFFILLAFNVIAVVFTFVVNGPRRYYMIGAYIYVTASPVPPPHLCCRLR